VEVGGEVGGEVRGDRVEVGGGMEGQGSDDIQTYDWISIVSWLTQSDLKNDINSGSFKNEIKNDIKKDRDDPMHSMHTASPTSWTSIFPLFSFPMQTHDPADPSSQQEMKMTIKV
jgi:hypothetical protein